MKEQFSDLVSDLFYTLKNVENLKEFFTDLFDTWLKIAGFSRFLLQESVVVCCLVELYEENYISM